MSADYYFGSKEMATYVNAVEQFEVWRKLLRVVVDFTFTHDNSIASILRVHVENNLDEN